MKYGILLTASQLLVPSIKHLPRYLRYLYKISYLGMTTRLADLILLGLGGGAMNLLFEPSRDILMANHYIPSHPKSGTKTVEQSGVSSVSKRH